jgi:hypothetical protein
MAATKETKILGINDLKICVIAEDTDADYRLSSTGGNAEIIDVKGIQTLSLTPTFVEKDLRGDEVILDRYTKLDSISWSFTNAIMSLDALKVLYGGDIVASGSGTDETQTFTLRGLDLPKYFYMEAQTLYSDAGDVHVVLYKCKASKVDYELKGEDYAVVSVSGMAIPTTYSFGSARGGKVKDVVINETAQVIDAASLASLI